MCSSPRGGRLVVKHSGSKVGAPVFRAGIGQFYRDQETSEVTSSVINHRTKTQRVFTSENKVTETSLWSQFQHWFKAQIS